MTSFQHRRRRRTDPGAQDAIAATIAEILRRPPPERMKAFAAAMVQLRDALAAANLKASKRDLATRGQEIGLRILDAITAAAHRGQQQAANKLDLPTKENP